MAKVIFEFDYYEDKDEIEELRRCSQYSTALYEIYNLSRSQLKHGDEPLSDNIYKLLEEIKQLAGIIYQD